MFRVAVCDDNLEECGHVAACASAFFSRRNMPVEIDTYDSGTRFLASGKTYDLYFFDVIMPQLSGMETARTLRKREEEPVIIFVTSSLESAVEGYSVFASGFVLKPIEPPAFEETMTRVFKQRFESRAASIQVVHNRVCMELKLAQIAYFENRLHQVHVILSSGDVLLISQKLRDLETVLARYPQFLRCHQSYLVNLDRVERLEPDCFILCGNTVVPISRNFYKKSKIAYYHHKLR